ncbi:Serine/threonine-protein phosphatase [Caenorhabditis elegans]|uniref:Serine/threonine-protein phosphatase n=1 Tax=Caenorhabditis elegans TaxID=6239 RepID=Q9U395_CAEEL|nr:Serine/threonine-protein phosphatase [Caenorhabditis elegans]CAB57902.2 Serine/threonine-protein phosphatase [Caenorhabditis elegans]|eukprot:NP_506632.2 Serine/threonine-protein phosphatase [Caenorhabditis elegans]
MIMESQKGDLYEGESVDQLAKRMIEHLLKWGVTDAFNDKQIYTILEKAESTLNPLPAMLQVEHPITIVGDIHGQLDALIRYFDAVGYPPKVKFLFLGDYVDRGAKSFEVSLLLFCYKIRYPHSVHLLRGNHECMKMNRLYGFYEELARKRGGRMWRQYQNVFNELPLCARVGQRILCMHGGISQNCNSWESFKALKKPNTPLTCDEGLQVDLMWADPTQDKCNTFAMNKQRAISVVFGEKGLDVFLKKLGLSLIVRAHEVSQEGFNFLFNKKCVTVFSAPYYCGNDTNCGAIMHVSESYEISFTVLRPRMIATPENIEIVKLMENNYKGLRVASPDPNRGRHLQSADVPKPTAPSVQLVPPVTKPVEIKKQ